MLKYILLGFLNYQPLSGYELKRLMDESTSHFWHAYHSQIYTTLRKLDDEGLLESEEAGESDAKLQRRVYTITEAGRRDLLDWLGQPLAELPQVKEELLLRVFFSGQRETGAVLEELRRQRRMHQEKLDYYNALQPQHLMGIIDSEAQAQVAREVPFWAATLSYGKRYEAMYLAWLDETIAMIAGL